MLLMLLKLCLLSAVISFSIAVAGAAEEPNLGRLKAALGGNAPDSVKPAPIPGLYEVILDGQVLYLTEDGRYVMQGDVIDLNNSSNITEARRSELRSAAIAALDKANMVVFSPAKPAKHAVTVFTDIDCGYCRQLHQEIASYNDQGIEVRYLMFPRAGVASPSYSKAVSVWCASDRNDAMTRAKRGETIASKSCANPVNEQYELGQSLGIRGTPSMILEDGRMVPGYVPANRLAQMLETSTP